jgi:hypothetical protein
MGAPGSLAFAGTQPLETVGAPQTATITNIGSDPLSISGLTFAGSDPGDFFVGSDGCLGPIATGTSCSLTVDFAPHATGARTATLQIASNDPNGPASVALSGTGGQLPQGAPGANGSTGATGPQGPAGKVELVTCKTVTTLVKKKIKGKTRKVKVPKQVCTAKEVSGTVKFTTTKAGVRASISRGRDVYASGTGVPTAAGSWQLVLSQRRSLRAGRYTLTLNTRRDGRSTTKRLQVMIA